MNIDRYTIEEKRPSPEEFIDLIHAVGWTRYTNLEVIPQALEGSLVAYVATCEGKVIGMGRLVGDGFRFVYIQDLAVHPEHQRRGVGTAIMDRLMDYINQKCPEKTYVHLFTGKDDASFYERYGFQGPESFYGMSLKKFDEPLGREGD